MVRNYMFLLTMVLSSGAYVFGMNLGSKTKKEILNLVEEFNEGSGGYSEKELLWIIRYGFWHQWNIENESVKFLLSTLNDVKKDSNGLLIFNNNGIEGDWTGKLFYKYANSYETIQCPTNGTCFAYSKNYESYQYEKETYWKRYLERAYELQQEAERAVENLGDVTFTKEESRDSNIQASYGAFKKNGMRIVECKQLKDRSVLEKWSHGGKIGCENENGSQYKYDSKENNTELSDAALFYELKRRAYGLKKTGIKESEVQ